MSSLRYARVCSFPVHVHLLLGDVDLSARRGGRRAAHLPEESLGLPPDERENVNYLNYFPGAFFQSSSSHVRQSIGVALAGFFGRNFPIEQD